MDIHVDWIDKAIGKIEKKLDNSFELLRTKFQNYKNNKMFLGLQ